METRLADIKADVNQIKEDVSDIKVTLGINTESLKLHVKRTDDLQDMVEEFKKHMIVLNTAIKVIIGVGSVLLFLQQLGLLDKIL